MPDLDLQTLDLITAITQLHQREMSALDLVKACLRQIERFNPEINAFITLTPELAIQAAMQADAILAGQPSNLNDLALLDMPIAVKDMIDVAGVRTTGGTVSSTKSFAREDAQVVLKLKLAGALILGKTNTHEIALGVTGVNPHYGPVKNPWDTTCISGGSSSGSAAAVASGMCLAAIGTDTGGSIRIPAALCGVVGFKPTYGRVSTRGVLPLSWNLDHIGPLTHTVLDAALMLSVMAGFDTHDPVSVNVPAERYSIEDSKEIQKLHICLGAGPYVEAADQEVLAAVENAARVFKDMGAHVTKEDISWLEAMAQANGRMTTADAAAFHRQSLAEHPKQFGEDVRERLKLGAALSSTDYAMARRTQTEARRKFDMFFEKYDLLILPTTPIPAPPIEDTAPLIAARQLTRFTAPFNLTGLPALSVPCGFSNAGLPIGLQIVSKPWNERLVLLSGAAFEEKTDWHTKHPALRLERE